MDPDFDPSAGSGVGSDSDSDSEFMDDDLSKEELDDDNLTQSKQESPEEVNNEGMDDGEQELEEKSQEHNEETIEMDESVETIENDEPVLEINGRYFFEKDVIREKKNKDIFILKIKETAKRKRGKDFQQVFSCVKCGKLIMKNNDHLKKVHHEDLSEVFDLPNQEREKELRKLSQKGNHQHNMRVIKQEEGLFILGRRTTGKDEVFDLERHSPCPMCFEWVTTTNLTGHALTCPAKDLPTHLMTVDNIAMASRVLCNRLNQTASILLSDEVFSTMHKDRVAEICLTDDLLIMLGNFWLQKNIENVLARKYYTAHVMRLLARIIFQVRLIQKKEDMTLSEMLSPKNFDDVVTAAYRIAGRDGDTWDRFTEDLGREEIAKLLKAPSNIVKTVHLLKRIANMKKVRSIKSGDEQKAMEAMQFLEILSSDWETSMANLVLRVRKYQKNQPLPDDNDLKKFLNYIKEEMSKIAEINPENYRHAVCLAEALLVIFNSRRPGEVQDIR